MKSGPSLKRVSDMANSSGATKENRSSSTSVKQATTHSKKSR
jgi:hypothetical protein